jgi:hypothetical protein
MRFIFYAMAWGCIVIASVYSGFVATTPGSQWLAAVLLCCGVLLAFGGYIFTRRTTRKCPFCGERVGLTGLTCGCCGTTLLNR